MSAPVTFRVLGPLEVWRDGEQLGLGAAKQRALLGLLLIRRGAVARDVLIDALWGEKPPTGARNTLQVYVSRLRRLLGDAVIETTSTGYQLHVEPDSVDAQRFESLFRNGQELLARDGAEAALDALSTALALWRGPAFADLRYEAFAQAEAGRLDELRLACVEERIDAELALGRHAGLVGELESLIVEHPLRERLRGQLILALYRSGRQSEALAQYQAARRMLADELGLEPTPELRALERMILAHDPTLAPPAAPASPRSNLPLQPTPFIGREAETAALVEVIRAGGRRLVTLTGAGGSGKTRLAIEATAQIAGDYPDGVWWVPLQALADPNLVPATIAGAIDAKGELAGDIGDKRMLLLLDNFEQLLDAGPETAALLASCRNLTLLVTSRERLHVAAEREFLVAPMNEDDAALLFDEHSVRPGGAEVVAEICRRIDCLPLAVELAAAQTRTLAPEEILARLDERLPLLAGGPRDAPARQRTLSAAIEWSVNLLEPNQKTLFGQLSMFADGGDLEAVAAVCELSDAEASERLSSLVDKSLARQSFDVLGRPRYSMLQTVREYATDLLEAGGRRPAMRRRHAEYFCSLLDRAVRIGNGEDVGTDDDADQRVLHELGNLREALAFALAEGDLELALTLAGTGNAWGPGGAAVEGRVWLRRVLDRTEHIRTPRRARAVAALGGLELVLGNLRNGEGLIDEARALYAACADVEGEFRAIEGLITLAAYRGDQERCRSLIERAQALAGEVSDYQRAQLLFAEADVASYDGADDRADRLRTEGLELVERLGVPRRIWAWQLLNIGWSLILREDFPRARAAIEEYLAEPSRKPLLPLGIAHANLGLIELFERRTDEASSHFRRALELVREVGNPMHLPESLCGLAAVAALNGRWVRATTLWGSAEAVQRATGFPFALPQQRIVDRFLEPVRVELDHDLFAEAYAEGAAMTLSEAIAYALEES
jgi:predicted ATPase/DNA-binding SARP family transcriptional activator